MPNRYALGGGDDWWSANQPGQLHTDAQGGSFGGPTPSAPGVTDPGIVSRAPNSGVPREQGGIAGPGVSFAGAQGGQAQGPDAFGGDYQQWFNSLIQGKPFNQQTILDLEPTLKQYGVQLTPPNAMGERTKIGLPNGQWVRVGFGEGHPVWNVQPGSGGAAGGAGTGPYSGPGAIPPPFAAPSFEDLQKEPGFQARYQMGLQGLERGAAAQGSILSGGTQKALARYGQDYASNEYGNAYNRAFNTYMGNYKTQSADPWQRYQDVYQGGLNAALGTKTNTPIFPS